MPALILNGILVLVGLALAAVTLRVLWRHLRSSGCPATMRVLLISAALGAIVAGSTKVTPTVGDRIGNFVYWTAQGRLEDPTGIIAEYAETAAVEAFEAETAGIVAAVTNAVVGVTSDANDLLDYVHNRRLALIYLAVDAPRDIAGILANHNISITAERQSVADGIMSVWFRFSRELSEAPTISAMIKTTTGPITLTACTNMFPEIEFVGLWPCYQYCYDLRPITGTNAVVVVAPYEATFGGTAESGLPLSTPADIEVVSGGGAITNAGFTGLVMVPHMPGLALAAEGGIVVGATVHGTNYVGITTDEVFL